MSVAKLNELDDELIYKRVKIKISSSKSVITPIKATNYLNPLSEINEIYRQFSLDRLKEIMKDKEKDDRINSSIRNETKDSINFFFVNYIGKEIPNDNQIDALVETQYPYSDMLIPPLFSKIVNNLKEYKLLSNFLDLTNKSLESISSLNHKPILGVIPAVMPRQFLKPILKNYENQDITSFAIDFNGRSIDTNMSWATALMRLMADYDLTEESFIYGINHNSGRFIKQSNEILAKDFISMGLGVDIQGCNHISPGGSPEYWNNLKNQRKESLYRIFDTEDYSYTKKWESELHGHISGNVQNEIKRQNLASQYHESKILCEKLNDNHTLEPYISSKNQVTPEIINNMKILRKAAFDYKNHKKLDNWI